MNDTHHRSKMQRGRLLALAASLALIGCDEPGTTCSDNIVDGLQVTTGTGAPVSLEANAAAGGAGMGGAGAGESSQCDVVVKAIGDDAEEQLWCFGSGVNCTCSGLPEKDGFFEVRAEWGEAFESENVTITADECHVKPQSLVFFKEYGGFDAEQAALDKDVARLKSLATAESCSDASDCSTVGVGEKACGGRHEWLVYSTVDADSEAIEKLATQIVEDERALNAKYNLASDCAYAVEPTPACEANKCVAVHNL